MFKQVIFVFILSLALINVKGKIVIDNDAGGDDAMAIFLALLYEKYYDGPTVLGLTTVHGNTNEDNVCVNNQRILKVAKRQEVPIYRGSKSSLLKTPYAENYYGMDGLGDFHENLTDLVPHQKKGAVEALIELSKQYPGELTVVTIGTVTNIALAMKLDPRFLSRLNHLYVGAGHIHDEKNPNPEFNAHMDAEAYHVIMQSAAPEKVTIFPFSQTKEHLNFTREWRENVLGAIETDIIRAQNKYEQVSLPKNDGWASLDPSVVAVVLKPSLVTEYKYSKHDIIICGEKRGINTNTFVEKDDANVRVVYSINPEAYKKFLLDVFSAELKTEQKDEPLTL